MSIPAAADVAFRARALAQAHPLSAPAAAAIAHLVAGERAAQPRPEVAEWAAAALVAGYCVRRVEESDGGRPVRATGPIDAERLNDEAAALAAALRRGEPIAGVAPAATLDALDRVIGSEIERRLDDLRAELDADACAEVEEYLTWCVVHGYALRLAEARWVDAAE